MTRKRRRSSRLERSSCIIYLKNSAGKWERFTSNMSKEEHIERFKIDFAVGVLRLINCPYQESHIEIRSANFGYGIHLKDRKKEFILQESRSTNVFNSFLRSSFR